MQFTTPIPIAKSNFPIDYQSKILLMGSCFVENIFEKFQYFKFQSAKNPFGIIFNPISIEKLIHRIVNKIAFSEKDIFFHNESWHCFEVHSELSNPDKSEFLQTLNTTLELAHQQILQVSHIILTYGTAWVYTEENSGEVVANCHKVPQSQFTKKLLDIDSVEKAIQNSISLIQKINPNCKFIFTISPVRHIKDGFFENNVSKSHLISAVFKTISQQPSTMAYFPSYEIMVDELRDYRFYAEDMLHPNQTAIDYIWIRFFENYIDEKEFETMNAVCSIQRDLKHKPFNPNSKSHQQFLNSIQQKISTLALKNPNIQF